VVIALLTSWRMAASICSGVLRLVLLCLFSAACRAWSRADWGEARQTAAGSPQGEPAERRRVSQQGNVVANLRGGIAGGAKGEDAGQLRHHLHPALLAVGFSGRPFGPVKAVHHVTCDGMLFERHGDG